MKDNPNNPFLVTGYHSPSYFCDRETDTEKIISALTNDRNISLIIPRRIDKTGLIHQAFYQLTEHNKSVFCFYLDIFSTQNLYEFVELLGKTVFGKLDTYSETMVKRIAPFFKSFRSSFTFNAFIGNPSVSLNIQKEQTETGFMEIFDYLKTSGKRSYIAIDEFQQITDYSEKGVEALLRSYMQFMPNVKFISSGSKKHLMDAKFSSVNRPFYQSTQKIGLKKIPIEIYRQFATDLFSSYKKSLTPVVFDYIYHLMMGHTWHVQYLLNHLFSLSKNEYSEPDVNILISGILQEENATFKTYCEVISKGQLRLLKAIGTEKKVSLPYEAAFMRKHNLTTPSSVKLALSSLTDKTFILKDEDGAYYVYDRFYSLWMAQ